MSNPLNIKQFQKDLKVWRRKNKLYLKEVETKFGVSYSSLSNIIYSNESKGLQVSNYFKLCAMMGKDVNDYNLLKNEH